MKKLTKRMIVGTLNQDVVKRISEDILAIRESADYLEEVLLEYLCKEKLGKETDRYGVHQAAGGVMDTCNNLLHDLTGQSY